MRPVKIIHCADIHVCREKEKRLLAFKSLETLANTAKEQEVDLIALAGDLFDSGLQASDRDGYNELLYIIQHLLSIAPIVAVEGTVTHDYPGCYRPLEKLSSKHSFTILYPDRHYLLDSRGEVHIVENEDLGHVPDERLLILGMGEPQKGWLLAGKNGIGKDDALAAIKTGMKEILLGLGSIRKEYPSTPALMLYHGEVEGASMCNGQTLPAGGISMGRDDLAMVGADYYALGHIHKAQQIGDLPAYYSGSAYPVDWGETEQKRFNVISFEKNNAGPDSGWGGAPFVTDVAFINYPHPPRKKITIDFHDIDQNLDDHDYVGFQTWLNVRMMKDDTGYDPDVQLKCLLNDGALPGSRVTTETIPTETVRAGEIAEAKRLRDKVIVYAENSGEEAAESVLDKADVLEAEAESAGASHSGAWIQIRKLALRGAIGIWKGTGKDEIVVDLDEYDPGLIALLGPNGAGKTTLIENMHPYTQMLTRQGKLQDHFRLRDSYRDLYFTDERTGAQYRALMLIDGQNKSGSVEYHLYKDGKPITNGRREDYQSRIDELFGSLELYLRSAFITQKPTKGNPDLAAATQGEKKALFRELAGLDYLQEYSIAARERAKVIEGETERDRGRVQAMTEATAKLPVLMGELVGNKYNLTDVEKKHADLEGQTATLTTLVSQFAATVEQNRTHRTAIVECRASIEKLEGEQNEIVAARGIYNTAVAEQESAVERMAEYEQLRVRKEELEGEQKATLEKRDQARTDYIAARQVVADEDAVFEKEACSSLDLVQDLKAHRAVLIQTIDYLDEKLQQKVECPNCSHKFAIGAETDETELAEKQQKVADIDVELEAAQKTYREQQALREALVWPDEPTLPEFDSTKLAMVTDALTGFRVDELRALLDRAKEATIRLEALDNRDEQITGEIESVQRRIAEHTGQIDDTADAEHERLTIELEQARAALSQFRDEKTRLETTQTELRRRIDELEEQARECEHVQKSIQQKEADASEWRYLERACGPDGIQALELDALAPSITTVANSLLSAAYGSQFQVEIRTTRIGGTGSRTKQIEDFRIVVHNTEAQTEQELDTLSGGESTWIRKAIYDAFGVVRTRNTGLQFLTVCMDETDSALDPDARDAYFRLITAAHEESGRTHTILITHSPEAQQYIGQHIVMAELPEPAKQEAVE